MSDQPTYRAAIIGLGFVGGGDQVSGDRIGQRVSDLDGHHRGALSKHSRIDLVAGCDPDPGRRERFAQTTSARTYEDWQAMLERERPELVSIATWTPAHAELTMGCAAQGVRAVYCEKPIATTVADAQRMIDACRQSGTLLVINHNRRFNPNYRRLAAAIAEGALGRLTTVSLRWPTGRLGCVGTHLIDAARMLTGREIVAVSGTLDLTEVSDCRGPQFFDPGGWAMLRMEGELVAVLSAANAARGPVELLIEGTAGRAVTGGDEVRLTWFDGREDHWPSRKAEATSMDRAVDEIVAWLDERAPFPVPPEEALRTLEAIVAIHLSHDRQAQWVPLPLEEAERDREVRSG